MNLYIWNGYGQPNLIKFIELMTESANDYSLLMNDLEYHLHYGIKEAYYLFFKTAPLSKQKLLFDFICKRLDETKDIWPIMGYENIEISIYIKHYKLSQTGASTLAIDTIQKFEWLHKEIGEFAIEILAS